MSLSCGGDGNQEGQVVPKHPDGGGESPSRANNEKEEKWLDSVTQSSCAPATKSPNSVIKQMEVVFFSLGFSWEVAQKLVYDQGIDSPRAIAILSGEGITVICDVIRRLGGLVAGKMLEKGKPNFHPCDEEPEACSICKCAQSR